MTTVAIYIYLNNQDARIYFKHKKDINDKTRTYLKNQIKEVVE